MQRAMVKTEYLPISETISPADQAELANTVRGACGDRTPLYIIGGGSALDAGLPARRKGIGLSVSNLRRVVDYPDRDLTITVEAGLTISELDRELAVNGQWLPVDAGQPDQATIGGLVATAFSGPRRYWAGTIRDYVIGITAVDGRGVTFHGGGRVVKNVAGYDFCKLLCGSFGTLGVVTQVTLKVKPRPQRTAIVAIAARDAVHVEGIVSTLIRSRATPSAIEWLLGPHWETDAALSNIPGGYAGWIVVVLDGTGAEVAWMVEFLGAELAGLGSAPVEITETEMASFYRHLVEFGEPSASPLLIKASLLSSTVGAFVDLVRQVDGGCSIEAHAANGIVLVRFALDDGPRLTKGLLREVRPAAVKSGGSVVVWGGPPPADLTRQLVWGPEQPDAAIMRKVKLQFDPVNILNPDRFVYGPLELA